MTDQFEKKFTYLHIDWGRCDGRGLCVELLPEVLVQDDWGYPLLKSQQKTADKSNILLSSKLLPAAKDAVKLCPKSALFINQK